MAKSTAEGHCHLQRRIQHRCGQEDDEDQCKQTRSQRQEEVQDKRLVPIQHSLCHVERQSLCRFAPHRVSHSRDESADISTEDLADDDNDMIVNVKLCSPTETVIAIAGSA